MRSGGAPSGSRRRPYRSVDGEDNTTSPERRASSRVCVRDRYGCGLALRGHVPAPLGEPARSTAERLGQRPTPVERRNEANRLPGGEPCAGESHARFCRGQLETDSCLNTAPAAYLTLTQSTSLLSLPECLLTEDGNLDPVVRRQARHVVTENARALAAAEALRRGDVAGLGSPTALDARCPEG